MSLNFKTDLKEMRENDPTGVDALDEDYKTSKNYDTPGHVRNLCFVWPDGRRKFMNYAYLISGEYMPEKNLIVLLFTTESITMVGFNFSSLYQELLIHAVKSIFCVSERYNSIIGDEPLVQEIIIQNLQK